MAEKFTGAAASQSVTTHSGKPRASVNLRTAGRAEPPSAAEIAADTFAGVTEVLKFATTPELSRSETTPTGVNSTHNVKFCSQMSVAQVGS